MLGLFLKNLSTDSIDESDAARLPMRRATFHRIAQAFSDSPLVKL